MVEYIVAIDVTRARFPADALRCSSWAWSINSFFLRAVVDRSTQRLKDSKNSGVRVVTESSSRPQPRCASARMTSGPRAKNDAMRDDQNVCVIFFGCFSPKTFCWLQNNPDLWWRPKTVRFFSSCLSSVVVFESTGQEKRMPTSKQTRKSKATSDLTKSRSSRKMFKGWTYRWKLFICWIYPPPSSSGKWRFRLGFPILKMQQGMRVQPWRPQKFPLPTLFLGVLFGNGFTPFEILKLGRRFGRWKAEGRSQLRLTWGKGRPPWHHPGSLKTVKITVP